MSVMVDGRESRMPGSLSRISTVVAPGKQWVMEFTNLMCFTIESPIMAVVGGNRGSGVETGGAGHVTGGAGETTGVGVDGGVFTTTGAGVDGAMFTFKGLCAALTTTGGDGGGDDDAVSTAVVELVRDVVTIGEERAERPPEWSRTAALSIRFLLF